MTNIYEKLKINNKNNKEILVFLILVIINLISLNFFIKHNLNYLFSIDINKYLFIISLFFIFNFSLALFYLIYDLEKFIILNILMIILIYLNLNKLLIDNYLLGFTLLGIFILIQFLIYFSIEKIYKNNILINWLAIFKISWNYSILTYLIFIFLLLSFLPSLEKLNFQDIYFSLGKFNLFFNNQFSLDQKIVNLINKNIDENLPQKIKIESLNNSIKELNNKFNIDLNINSTIREAIAKYLANQIDIIKKNNEKSVIIKSTILFLVIIIIQPIFYFMGFLVAYLYLFLIKILIYLKIFKLSYNQVLKEQIEF